MANKIHKACRIARDTYESWLCREYHGTDDSLDDCAYPFVILSKGTANEKVPLFRALQGLYLRPFKGAELVTGCIVHGFERVNNIHRLRMMVAAELPPSKAIQAVKGYRVNEVRHILYLVLNTKQ
jgi:hypothetical protein